IVGNGPMMEEIKSSKTPNVEVLGFKFGKELMDLIMNAKFVIIPSECYENHSMSAVESLSMSKPIIGSKIGALSEIIKNGFNGFLFEVKNENELNLLVKKASNLSEEKYKELSDFSYNYAINNFSASVYFDKLTSLYKEILSRQKN
ncbi:MAG: glycosyltransferase, partial [Ignavibacteria bacterium]|nr:glycosyltransferase [Ignavibacteria bacterium]